MTDNKGKGSQMNYMPDATETTVRTGIAEVEALSIFYREAGNRGNPKLVLLHGFPASSHQYRNLIPARANYVSPEGDPRAEAAAIHRCNGLADTPATISEIQLASQKVRPAWSSPLTRVRQS